MPKFTGLIILSVLYFTAKASADWQIQGQLIKDASGTFLVMNPLHRNIRRIDFTISNEVRSSVEAAASGLMVIACFTGTKSPERLISIEALAPSLDPIILESVEKSKIQKCK